MIGCAACAGVMGVILGDFLLWLSLSAVSGTLCKANHMYVYASFCEGSGASMRSVTDMHSPEAPYVPLERHPIQLRHTR
jgi:hypothetical protein